MLNANQLYVNNVVKGKLIGSLFRFDLLKQAKTSSVCQSGGPAAIKTMQLCHYITERVQG